MKSRALDVEGNVALAFSDVDLTPTSFLIGPDGSIVQNDVKIMDMNGLRKPSSLTLVLVKN